MISFFADVSTEAIRPILPLFITTVLGGTVFIVGLIEGIGTFLVSGLRAISGWLSDKTGIRKKFIVAGYSIAATMKVLFPFLTSWKQLLATTVFERTGKGIRGTPRDALIGASEPKQNIGKAVGYRKMMDSAGAICGPIIAAIIIGVFLPEGEETAYRTTLMVAVIPAIIAALLTLFVKEKRDAKSAHPITDVLHQPNYKTLLLIGIIFSIANFSYAFFILRTSELVDIIVLVPFAYAVYNAVYTTCSIPIGVMTERLGARVMFALCYLLFSIVTFGFGFFDDYLAIVILFALYGIFTTITEVTIRVVVLEEIHHKDHATAIGLYQGFTGIGTLPANIFAGLLWDVEIFSMRGTFVFAALVSLISLFLVLFTLKGDHISREPFVQT